MASDLTRALNKTAANKAGSDCTGVDGAVNRTLTVTKSLQADNLVVVGGRVLHPTEDYTYSGAIITFLVPISNTDKIRVVT